jgi:hypothetical protein
MPHVHECTGQDCCYCHCYHHFHQAPVSSHPFIVRRHSSLRRQPHCEPLASMGDKTASKDADWKNGLQNNEASAGVSIGLSVGPDPKPETTVASPEHDTTKILGSTENKTDSVSQSTPGIHSDDLPPTKPAYGASSPAKPLKEKLHGESHDGKEHPVMSQGHSDFVRAGGWGSGLGSVAAGDLGSFDYGLQEHKGHGAGNGWMDKSRAC